MCIHIPQKDLETRKREKHATKIPSSRGLFIEDSSCFFVSGPRVQKKRGEKEKRENSKKITGKKRKKIRMSKKKRRKSKKDKSARVHWCFCSVFSFLIKKQKQKESQTHLSQEKTQDQRKLLLKCGFPKKGDFFFASLLSFLSPKIPVSFLSLHELVVVGEGGGLRAEEGGEGRVWK